ncbi:hypothetical protein [Bradyrhizobium sp. 930_D9_N1_4]|uniref:hypothetical protein n=1 Tax=Bradyrhizobium sp. 930_D9_N1_4 TaxID=3240374 RepID=UPI003F8BCF80
MTASLPITYKAIGSVALMPPIDTAKLFAVAKGHNRSPIDLFFENTNNLNKLYLPYAANGSALPPELGAVVVLGYMSAVESYVRSVVSGIIAIDQKARDAVAKKTVSFAAAAHLPSERLPEALLEHLSLSDADTLEKTITATIGLKGVPNDVKASLNTFDKICHLRHCCVHRFGKLGTRNALDLGFERHVGVVEGPFSPSVTDITNIADALQITVMTINNFLFYSTLERTIDHQSLSEVWQLTYAKDKARFSKYYDLFSIKTGKPASPSPSAIYSSFVRDHKSGLKTILAKALAAGGP